MFIMAADEDDIKTLKLALQLREQRARTQGRHDFALILRAIFGSERYDSAMFRFSHISASRG